MLLGYAWRKANDPHPQRPHRLLPPPQLGAGRDPSLALGGRGKVTPLPGASVSSSMKWEGRWLVVRPLSPTRNTFRALAAWRAVQTQRRPRSPVSGRSRSLEETEVDPGPHAPAESSERRDTGMCGRGGHPAGERQGQAHHPGFLNSSPVQQITEGADPVQRKSFLGDSNAAPARRGAYG